MTASGPTAAHRPAGPTNAHGDSAVCGSAHAPSSSGAAASPAASPAAAAPRGGCLSRRLAHGVLFVVLLLLTLGFTTAAPGGSSSSSSGGPGLPRRMAAHGGGSSGHFGSVGFDREKTLGFVEYLSTDTLEAIDVFDRLSVGLNMTIEDFFSFINRLLEDDVPDKRDEDDWMDPDTLTVEQLGQLFGGVNETAVFYILDTLGASIDELQAGFNAVDVIMVLMFVSSHLEAGGVPLSILEIIAGFCDVEWEMLDANVWVSNVAKAKGVPEAKLAKLMGQLEGSLDDIRGYVEEIVRPDACDLILNGGFPTVSSRMAPRLGNLRGKGQTTHGALFGDEDRASAATAAQRARVFS